MRALLTGLILVAVPSSVFGQPSNFDFLRRMDANRNGRLEPDEISSRARPFLERIARDGGIRLSGSISISDLESAARRSFERRGRDSNDGDRRSSSTPSFGSGSSAPESIGGVRGFGPDDDTPVVPGFGPDGTIRYPFTTPDEQRAQESLQRYDENKDGGIDRAEAARGRWSDNPFLYDFNEDGLLSLFELAQRYARRRVAEEAQRRASEQSNRSEDRSRDDRGSDEQRYRDYQRGRGGPPGFGDSRDGRPDRRTFELAYTIIARYDRNRSGSLSRAEWGPVGDNVVQADVDHDGEISRDELTAWLSQDIQRRFKDASADLPTWFFELDGNGDRQVSMSEFTDQWDDEKLNEFANLDRNGDGFLTEKELLGSKAAVGGTYVNEKALVIMPVGTVVSDITVEENYMIGDLDVQLSITHTNDEQLNAYLVGPDGQRVELFTGVGRSDDHFDGTILDDEAQERITRSRPPFRGRFLPEAAEKKEPSLSHFYGKNVNGLWQLEIRTTSGDRPGMLHGWSLIVSRPEELDSAVRAEEPPAGEPGAETPPAERPPSGDARGSWDGQRPRSFGEWRGGGPPDFGSGGPPRGRYPEGGEGRSFRGGPPRGGSERGD